MTVVYPARGDIIRLISARGASKRLRFPGINLDSTPDLAELPLRRITAPTLIVSARNDGFNTLPAAEFLASRIPGARLIVYDTGGHLLVGHQEEVRAAVRAFLAGVPAPARAAALELART